MMRSYKKLLLLLIFIIGIIEIYAQDGDGLGYYVQAERLRQASRYRQAIDFYDKAIKDAPHNHKFIFQKGKCYILLRDEDNAISCFEKTIEIKEDYVQAYIRLAWLYQRKEKYNKAIKAFDNAYKYSSKPQQKLEFKTSIIKILYRTEQFSRAGRHIQQAKRVAPNNLDLLYYEAKYNNQMGSFENARKAMVKATTLLTSSQPKDIARFYFELGYALHNLGEFQQAKQVLQRANYGRYKILITRLTPQYNYSLATAYYKIFEYDECKKLLDYTLKIDPSFIRAHDLMVRMAYTNTDYTNQINVRKRAIEVERDPTRKANKYKELCELDFAAGRYQESIRSAIECLKIQPRHYEASFLKSIALYKIGKIKESKEELGLLVKYTGLDLETKAKYNFALGIISKKSADKRLAKKSFKAASYGSFRYAAANEITKLSTSSKTNNN